MSQHSRTGEEASSAPVCEAPSTWLGEPTVTFFHQVEYGRMPAGSTYLALTVDVAALMRDAPQPINRELRIGVAEAHRQLREWLGIPAAKGSSSKVSTTRIGDLATARPKSVNPGVPGKRPIPSSPWASASTVTSTPRNFQWVSGHLFGAHKNLPEFIDQIVASRPNLQASRLHEELARRVSSGLGSGGIETSSAPRRRRLGV